jgi:hypothetical protein
MSAPRGSRLGVRVPVVSAVHRSELERPPRTTVDSTAWKAWLCPLRHFFDQQGGLRLTSRDALTDHLLIAASVT